MPKVLMRPKSTTHLTLRYFHEHRNEVLIFRNIGGLGDILMHRMIFEDLKSMNPEMKIIFACPYQFHDAIKDHPFIDEVIDSRNLNIHDFNLAYNTTNCCSRYEMGIAPLADKHRSDIWANHCGVELAHHNMHISLSETELAWGREQIEKIQTSDGPKVLFCPLSAMSSKNLMAGQIIDTVKELRKLNCFVYSSHFHPIEEFDKINVPVLYDLKIREWMSIIMAADYVLSVDTSTFHFAGGMGKPVTGVFTWADGYVYGKYYPTATIVQFHRNTHSEWTCGPCYAWPECPLTDAGLKPCLTKINAAMIMKGVKSMMNKHNLLTTSHK